MTLGQSRTTGQKQDKLCLETSFIKPAPGQEREGLVWRRQEIFKDPMNKLLYQVAVEHFQDSVDTFRDEVLADVLVGGSSADFLAALSGCEGVAESALNIKLVRAALQVLVRYAVLVVFCTSESFLVSSSVSVPVHEPVLFALCISLPGSLSLALSHALSLALAPSRTPSISLFRMGTLKSSKQTNPTTLGEAHYFLPDTEVL